MLRHWRSSQMFALLGIVGFLATGGIIPASQENSAAAEWRAYGGDHASSGYSPLDQITSANVTDLEIVWEWA